MKNKITKKSHPVTSNRHEATCNWVKAVKTDDIEPLFFNEITDASYSKDCQYAIRICGFNWFHEGQSMTDKVLTYHPELKSFFYDPSYRFLVPTIVFESFAAYPINLYRYDQYHRSNKGIRDVEPMDKDLVLRLLYAEELYGHPSIGLLLSDYFVNPPDTFEHLIVSRTSCHVPVIGLARIVSALPDYNRNKIFEYYDRFKCPDPLLSDAIEHLDKFRTL